MKSDSRSAFTLIEVLVVIAITSLLAGMILSYSSASRDQVTLRVEQAKLSQTIIKAKSLTVSTYNDPAIPCGYGVHIDYAANSYSLFSYGDVKDLKQDSPCDSIVFLEDEFKTEISSNQLPASLTFGKPDGKSIEDVLFMPPNPNTLIWTYESRATSTEGRIPLASKSGTFSVQILVSGAGQITF